MPQEPCCTLDVAGAAVKREQEACSDAQEAAVSFRRFTRELRLYSMLLAVAYLEGLQGACPESCGIRPWNRSAGLVL